MSLEQRLENIRGRLDVLVPQLSEDRDKLNQAIIDIASLKQKVTSEMEAIGRELRDIKQVLNSLAGTPQERRSRIWDLVLLAASNALGFFLGWKSHP